jgi:hypothetical protein
MAEMGLSGTRARATAARTAKTMMRRKTLWRVWKERTMGRWKFADRRKDATMRRSRRRTTGTTRW